MRSGFAAGAARPRPAWADRAISNPADSARYRRSSREPQLLPINGPLRGLADDPPQLGGPRLQDFSLLFQLAILGVDVDLAGHGRQLDAVLVLRYAMIEAERNLRHRLTNPTRPARRRPPQIVRPK